MYKPLTDEMTFECVMEELPGCVIKANPPGSKHPFHIHYGVIKYNFNLIDLCDFEIHYAIAVARTVKSMSDIKYNLTREQGMVHDWVLGDYHDEVGIITDWDISMGRVIRYFDQFRFDSKISYTATSIGTVASAHFSMPGKDILYIKKMNKGDND